MTDESLRHLPFIITSRVVADLFGVSESTARRILITLGANKVGRKYVMLSCDFVAALRGNPAAIERAD